MSVVHSYALLITSANCQAVTGMSWRHVRDWCAAHDIPILFSGRRATVSARAFLEAHERAQEAQVSGEDYATHRASFAAKRRAAKVK